MASLKLSDMVVENRPYNSPNSCVSEAARRLFKEIELISRREGFIPLAVKDKALVRLGGVISQEDADLFDRLFAPLGNHSADLSPDEFWHRVVEVNDAALECQEEYVAEAGWNSAVHYPVLKLALRGFWEAQGIRCYDVSSARISDSSLLPSIAANATNMQSKKVDYALVIKPDVSLAARIKRKLNTPPAKLSINHTAAQYISFKPMAISMETKCGAVGEDEAHLQLGTWAHAHFARLLQLVPKGTKMPMLPLVKIQCHEWKLMIAEQIEDNKIVIWTQEALGGTQKVSEIYKLVAGIRRLARWIDEVYRVWFVDNVLRDGL